MPTRFRLELMWNGSTCLDGMVSASLAYANIRAHITDNFVGFVAPVPTLESIKGMKKGQKLTGEYEDSTGSAAYVLKCEYDEGYAR